MEWMGNIGARSGGVCPLMPQGSEGRRDVLESEHRLQHYSQWAGASEKFIHEAIWRICDMMRVDNGHAGLSPPMCHWSLGCVVPGCARERTLPGLTLTPALVL